VFFILFHHTQDEDKQNKKHHTICVGHHHTQDEDKQNKKHHTICVGHHHTQDEDKQNKKHHTIWCFLFCLSSSCVW
jgi:hypothetical protein